MFEKFTFEKKLGIDSSENKWRGLKVMTASFLLAMFGALLVFLGAIETGRVVVVAGITGGFVGMAMHFVSMFRIFRESRK